MVNKTETYLEKVLLRFWAFICENRISFLSGLVAGLAAHMFTFSNKLVNADDVVSIFEKGATIDSGRWGIEITWKILPNVSAPWIHGTISMLLIVIASCLVLRVFALENKLIKVLLPSVFTTFPAITGTYCYMFTSSAYGLSFLLAVISVCIYVGVLKVPEKLRFVAACAALVLSLGIFQGYIATVASFFVIIMIQRLLAGEHSAKAIFVFGVKSFVMLVVSLVLYLAVSLAAVMLGGGELITYAVNSENGFLFKIALAYSSFIKSFIGGYFGFVNSGLSTAVHLITLALCALLIIAWMFTARDKAKIILLTICIILLPLSIYCIYLIATVGIIYTLVLYSFTSVYVFAAVIFDYACKNKNSVICIISKEVIVIGTLLVVINNIYFANKVYMKMHLQYENAYSYFTGLVTQLRMTEGYDEELELAIVGSEDNCYDPEELNLGEFSGPSNIINAYTRDYFIERYVGFAAHYADADEKYIISQDECYKEMPVYPYEGSICRIDDYMVVKIG